MSKEMITPDQINWVFFGHISQMRRSIRAYRDFRLGLEKETVVRLNAAGFPVGKGKAYYFISGDRREFKTEQALCDAYNELAKTRIE